MTHGIRATSLAQKGGYETYAQAVKKRSAIAQRVKLMSWQRRVNPPSGKLHERTKNRIVSVMMQGTAKGSVWDVSTFCK